MEKVGLGPRHREWVAGAHEVVRPKAPGAQGLYCPRRGACGPVWGKDGWGGGADLPFSPLAFLPVLIPPQLS